MEESEIRSTLKDLTKSQLIDFCVYFCTTSVMGDYEIEHLKRKIANEKSEAHLAELDRLTEEDQAANKKLYDYEKDLRSKYGDKVRMMQLTDSERRKLCELTIDSNAKDDAYMKFIKKDR